MVTLDPRSLQAQIAQAEANVARDQAQLEMAERDLRRSSELAARGAGPQLTVDNSKTQADTYRAAIRADNAVLENLKVQLSFCFIRAPISGRISMAGIARIAGSARSTDSAQFNRASLIGPPDNSLSASGPRQIAASRS